MVGPRAKELQDFADMMKLNEQAIFLRVGQAITVVGRLNTTGKRGSYKKNELGNWVVTRTL